MIDFAKRLQKLMDEKDYKIADVIALSKRYDDSGKGVSKVNMCQWLNGTYQPSMKKIAILSALFGVNPNYLIGNTDEKDYDREMLEKEVQLCDLMQVCYGKEAYKIVEMYISLNEDGKRAAYERIQELTQLDKFVKRGTGVQKMA